MNASAEYSPVLQAFGADFAAAVIHQQDAFNEALGDADRQADLKACTLTGADQVLHGVTCLGSFSHSSQTWLWMWANPGFDKEDPAVAATAQIYGFGEQYGVPEFTTAEVDFSGFPDPHQAATTMVLTAGRILGGHGVWSTRINDGQGSVYLHIDDPQLPVAGFDLIAAPRLLTTAVTTFPADHRRVVRGYFDRYDVPYEETADAIVGRAPDGGTVSTTFDDQDRLTQVTVQTASA